MVFLTPHNACGLDAVVIRSPGIVNKDTLVPCSSRRRMLTCREIPDQWIMAVQQSTHKQRPSSQEHTLVDTSRFH